MHKVLLRQSLALYKYHLRAIITVIAMDYRIGADFSLLLLHKVFSLRKCGKIWKMGPSKYVKIYL